VLTATGEKKLFLNCPLVNFIYHTVLGFLVVSGAGFVNLLAKLFTPRVWMAAKAHGKTQRGLPTVLFAIRIIEHVYRDVADFEVRH
jgi:hypothetical protein